MPEPVTTPPPKCQNCEQKNRKDAVVCQWCSSPIKREPE